MIDKFVYNCILNTVCNSRLCSACKIKKYREANYIAWCDKVPKSYVLKYAQELYKLGDKELLDSIKYYIGVNESYDMAIKIICSGGVQYD